jgi:hypothetical protein
MVEAPHRNAEVAEQADASVSKTDVRKDVRVRLPISAPPYLWISHATASRRITTICVPNRKSLMAVLTIGTMRLK